MLTQPSRRIMSKADKTRQYSEATASWGVVTQKYLLETDISLPSGINILQTLQQTFTLQLIARAG